MTGTQKKKEDKEENQNGKKEKQNEKKEKQEENREKIRQLKEQEREAKEQLDELKGTTAKGKALCVLAFLLTFGVMAGILLFLIRTDAGGFASSSLAPAIGDVPVVRNLLPQDLRRYSDKELAAKAQKDSEAAQAQADSEAAAAQAQADSEAAIAQAQADSEAAAAQAQADSEAAQAQADSEAAAAAQAASESEAQAVSDAALADYVKTYSSMKAKDAAGMFDSMMPDQKQLVVKILQNMTAAQRSAILSKMNVQNASDITIEMDKELP